MKPMTSLLLLFLICGAILIGISIPLIQGRVGPNQWYGFRVRRTLEDPHVWYSVNRYSGWWLLGAGLAEIVIAIALYFVVDDGAVYASGVGSTLVAALIIGLIQSFRYLHQITK
ncbi:SdpI family protein [Trichothermofontia sp.]